MFIVGLVCGLSPFVSAQAGGDPTAPPAVVGKTMKTLDQVEARNPLVDGAPGVSITTSQVTVNGTDYSTQAVTISEPGSYYLTAGVIAGPGRPAIRINANQVSLDLNGMSLLSVNCNRTAIQVEGDSVTIKNGKIGLLDGVGFINGVSGVRITGTTYLPLRGATITCLQISDCSFYGIIARGVRTKVESCVVSESAFGLWANKVKDCQVTGITQTGIIGDDLISGSSAIVTNGTGILGGIIESCRVFSSV